MFFNETKEDIVRLISAHQPVSAREVFYKLKKKRHITYQAVFKTLQELVKNGVLHKRYHDYELSKVWLLELYEFTHTLLKTHGLSPIDVFINHVGPPILAHLKGKNTCCILGIIPGGGRLYGQRLSEFLQTHEINAVYTDIDRFGEVVRPHLLRNRPCILVDHGTFTGSTYHMIIKNLQSVLTPEQRRLFKFVVERDYARLADFYLER